MAERIILTDDIDGSNLGDKTENDRFERRFSIGGSTYTLHLSDDNFGKLLDLLKPYMDVAKVANKTAATQPTGVGPKPKLRGEASEKYKAALSEYAKAKKEQRQDIAQWVKTTEEHKDVKIAERAAIAAKVLNDFYAANPEQTVYYGKNAVEAPSREDFLGA